MASASPPASATPPPARGPGPVLLLGDHPPAAALGAPVEHAPLDPAFAAGQPAALAAAYRRIDAFLTAHLPRADVKIGVAREVP
jgi:hypothetical protein